ncbi:hypothetical protein [Pseudosporangium ferrugineum]|nr:hypothetical protein [Pseudosporangium ferrugineum]
MFLVPLPAQAAPVPCGQAERYSAQSGGQILRLGQLDVDGERRGQGVHVGDAKSAMVAQASVSSAAVARMIDAEGAGASGRVDEMLQQQAPPTNAEAARRATGAADVGAISLGGGRVSTHARWQAGMACGAVVGEVTRAGAELRGAGILADGDAALVRVPGKVASESTTGLERRGEGAATVATAGLAGGDLELLDGAVKVEVVKAPSLRASMSVQDGGEVRYLPAAIKVSGAGIRTERLDSAGEDVEITWDGPGGTDGAESGTRRAGGKAIGGEDADTAGGEAKGKPGEGATGKPGGDAAPASGGDGLVGKLPVVGKLLTGGGDLPLPEVPGVPEVGQQGPEAAPAVAPGTRVRIQVGDVRQATQGRAIAARAVAFSVTITHGSPGQGRRSGYGRSIALAFDMGVLEAAAVAPESTAGVSDASAGAGGGLPITGPRVDVIALSGVALLIAGAGALIFGLRGRSRS